MSIEPIVSIAKSRTLEKVAVAALALGAALAMQWLLMDFRVGVYDEALSLYGAARVREGHVPYRDFWTLYGPGSFYLIAGFFELFGESVLAGRLFDLLCRTGIVVLVYHLGRLLAPRGAAWVAAVVALLVLVGAQSYEAPLYPAFGGALLATWSIARAFRGTHGEGFCLVAGLAVGCTVAFRSDLGVYAFVTAMVGVLHFYIGATALPRAAAHRRAALFVVGCAVVVVPMAVLLLVSVPIHDLHEDLVRIPFTVYGPQRSLPFPPLRLLFDDGPGLRKDVLARYIVYLPPIVLPLAMIASLRAGRGMTGDARTDPRPVVLRMLAVLLLCMILKGFVRVSLIHMAPALVVCAILGTAVFAVVRRRSLGILLGCAFLYGAISLAVTSETRGYQRRQLKAVLTLPRNEPGPLCAHAGNPRIGCFRVTAHARAVLEYIERHSGPDDPIYVGVRRHDRVILNDVDLYFLSGRHASTKWHDIHPGVQTTLAIQREMTQAFERSPPVLIVIDDELDGVTEPNASAISSGVTTLDDWIADRYAEAYRSGPYRILERRATPTSTPTSTSSPR